MKRFLTCLLAISMVLTSVSTIAFAEDETLDTEVLADSPALARTHEYEGTVYDDAVQLLSALKIMEGNEDGDFAPNATLTRAEMSALAIRFLGMGSVSSGIESVSYNDVADDFWGKSYIDMATALELVNGNGDGTFNPEGEVTAEEAIKIIVCALGYEAKAAERGGWPMGYLRVATELELMDGISFPNGYSTAIPRWKTAILLFNALDANLMEKKVYGDDGFFAVNENATALSEYHRIAKDEGVVEATYTTALSGQKLDPEDVVIDGVKYTSKLNMESATGYKVKFYYTLDDKPVKKEIVAYFLITDDEDQTVIDFDDVLSVEVSSSFDISITYYQNGKREKKLIAKNPNVMYNSKSESFATGADLQEFLKNNTNQGRYVYVKNNDNNVLFVENYDAYVVAMADDNNKRIIYNVYENGAVNNATLDLSDDDAPDRKVFVYGEDGSEIALTDLSANDVIMVYKSSDEDLIKIYQVRNTVTGIINQREIVPDIGDEEDTTPTPTPEPTPYWVDPIEVNMDGFNRTSATPGTYEACSGYKGEKVQDGRTIKLISTAFGASSQGYWGVGKWTNMMKTSGSWGMTDTVNVNPNYNDANRPAILGDTVFNLDRGDVRWGSDNASSATAAGFEDIYFGDEINVGDTVRITAWVYAYNIRKNLQDKTKVEDQINADVNFRMWLTDTKTEYNLKADNKRLSVNVPAKANQWTKVVLETTLKSDDLVARNLYIDNKVPDTEPMPSAMLFAGVKVERMVDPGYREVEPRPDVPIDSTNYDIYIEDVKYDSVNTFPTGLLKLGQTVTLLLDKYGKIVGYSASEALANYGFLINAGLVAGAFKDTLKLKIMNTDGTVTVYDTTPEIEAWDGVNVRKMAAGDLITNQPADPYKTFYVWSTNNASNFECVKRTWLDEKNKSDAASRKLIYFETNKDGKVDKILVPSMPEDHPDAKIKMIKDFEYTDEKKETLFHMFWPMWLFHADQKTARTENKYMIANRGIPFFVMDAQDYDDKDCHLGTAWGWDDNYSRGRTWHYAQLYRYPGSRTVDFIVANPDMIAKKNNWEKRTKYVIVDKVLKKEEGYTLKGYDLGSYLANHDVTYTFDEDLRLMEDIWATSPEADGERLTWDNIKGSLGKVPYKVAYEAPVMGGKETPYVNETNIHQGDIVRVSVDGTHIELLEVMYRMDVGIPSAYSPVNYSNSAAMYTKSGMTYGEVVEINSRLGYMKIKGYYWNQPSEAPISTDISYVSSTKEDKDFVSEISCIFFPSAVIRYWDPENEQYQAASFNDIEIGDHFFAIGNLEYPSECSIFYKK